MEVVVGSFSAVKTDVLLEQLRSAPARIAGCDCNNLESTLTKACVLHASNLPSHWANPRAADSSLHLLYASLKLQQQVYSRCMFSRLQNIKWEFAVIQSADSNAFVAPGGKVVVFSGLLDMVGRDDDQLAAVLAHEAGHTLARHVVWRPCASLHPPPPPPPPRGHASFFFLCAIHFLERLVVYKQHRV